MIWFSIGDIYFTRRYLFQKMTLNFSYVHRRPLLNNSYEENFADLVFFRTLQEFLPFVNESYKRAPEICNKCYGDYPRF